MPATIERLRDGLKDDAAQLARLAEVERLQHARMAVLERSIRARETFGFAEAQRIVLTKEAKILMDGIREQVARMEDLESRKLAVRVAGSAESASRALATIALGLLLDIAMLVFLFVRVRADALARIASARELDAARRLLRSVVDGSPTPIYLKDPDGRYLLVNRAFRELHPEAGGLLEGKTDRDLLPAATAGATVAADRQVMQEGLIVRFEETLPGPAGARYFFCIKVPLRDERENIIGVCGVMSDVTSLKEAEAEVRQLNRTLENRVTERTRELAVVNSRLQEANDQLEAFSYTVAHDLRAPLRGIQGFSQAVLEDYEERLDDTGQDYLRRIARAAMKMERLIDDLLSYSRLSRAELRIETVRLDDALADARQLIDAQLAQSGATLEVAAPLHGVSANHAACVLIMQNLLSNAAKFVRPGAASHIRIRTEPRPGGNHDSGAGGRVRLWVEDDGIGIAEDQQRKIFRPFERLHGQDEYPGTGIGLAIIEKAARRMGGACGVESAPGRGSRFWVEFAPDTETT